MEIKQNIELQNYNSFRTKAKAKLFYFADNISELTVLLQKYPDEKKLVVGKGNNIFFTHDFDGLIIKPEMKGISILDEDNENVEIEVMAGEDWDNFVSHCVENCYSGIENLSLIPGSVGAAPVQNIGAYGTELKDVVLSVKAINIENAELIEFTNKECEFEYRNSIFKRTKNYIITSVIFKLSKQFKYNDKYADLSKELSLIPTPTISQVRQAVINIRTRKLPDCETLPNAGSFFKNPVLDNKTKDILIKKLPDIPIYAIADNKFKTSAAYLIEKASLKGKRIGMMGVYENHSLILVNYGTDKGKDIVQFMNIIQNEVFTKFGIILEPEVQIY